MFSVLTFTILYTDWAEFRKLRFLCMAMNLNFPSVSLYTLQLAAANWEIHFLLV